MYKVFQVRITDENALRWEKTGIKGGSWKQNGRIHHWEQHQHHRMTSAGQNRADSCIKQQLFCPAAGFALLTQLKIIQGRHIISGSTVEMSHEQIMWKMNESFLSHAGKNTHARTLVCQFLMLCCHLVARNGISVHISQGPSVIQVFLSAEMLLR